jgi:peptidoglycan hydrolase CwlO-like protein
MKKRFLVIVYAVLFALAMSAVNAVDYDFENNEDYYAQLCSSAAAARNVVVCTAYQAYVNQKVKDAEKALKELEAELKDVKNNINSLAKKVTEYTAQIDQLEKDIALLAQSILDSENAIIDLGIQIEERTVHIDTIDESIKDRMVAMQANVSLNAYIDFMMGAKDFSDFIRRIEGINDITAYDRDQMNLLMAEVTALEEDKAEVERQKLLMEENRANLETSQTTLDALKASVTAILVEFRAQEEQLQEEKNTLVADLDATKDILKGVAEALKDVVTSSGFIRPYPSGFRISAGVWAYPEGGTHLGTDFAIGIGANIRAVANGVVVYNANNCPTYGYLGSTCGYPGRSGGGNQVYLIVSVNGKTYAVTYMHMMKDTVIPIGTIVNQGDYIGKTGSSGSSTGSHVHIEVVYLGTMSVGSYVTNWNGNLTFGTSSGTNALAYRCDYNGNRPPCRENPQTIFNVVVGKYY